MYTELNNKDWGAFLRQRHREITGDCRGITLPSSNDIRIEGTSNSVSVTLSESAVVKNMQDNSAAFEAWSLALRVWCEVERIELHWHVPPNECSTTSRAHYNRFLYRAERFQSLFPEWFELQGKVPSLEEVAGFEGPFYLNVAGSKRSRDSTNLDNEALLEVNLFNSEDFLRYFYLEKVGRQFPVGVFHNSVTSYNRIFPGRSSAIDLIGTGNGTLSIFELKDKNSSPAGILSELLLYTSIMRDAIPGPGRNIARFLFDSKPTGTRADVSAQDVTACKSIRAVMIGEQFHPLIGHPFVLKALNEAVARNWNNSHEKVPVDFAAVLLSGSIETGFEFLEVADLHV